MNLKLPKLIMAILLLILNQKAFAQEPLKTVNGSFTFDEKTYVYEYQELTEDEKKLIIKKTDETGVKNELEVFRITELEKFKPLSKGLDSFVNNLTKGIQTVKNAESALGKYLKTYRDSFSMFEKNIDSFVNVIDKYKTSLKMFDSLKPINLDSFQRLLSKDPTFSVYADKSKFKSISSIQKQYKIDTIKIRELIKKIKFIKTLESILIDMNKLKEKKISGVFYKMTVNEFEKVYLKIFNSIMEWDSIPANKLAELKEISTKIYYTILFKVENENVYVSTIRLMKGNVNIYKKNETKPLTNIKINDIQIEFDAGLIKNIVLDTEDSANNKLRFTNLFPIPVNHKFANADFYRHNIYCENCGLSTSLNKYKIKYIDSINVLHTRKGVFWIARNRFFATEYPYKTGLDLNDNSTLLNALTKMNRQLISETFIYGPINLNTSYILTKDLFKNRKIRKNLLTPLNQLPEDLKKEIQNKILVPHRSFFSRKYKYKLYSISAFNRKTRFARYKLHKRIKKKTSDFDELYIKMDELIDYKIQLNIDQEDYAPENSVIKMTPNSPVLDLKKAKLKELFKFKVFSDLLGLSNKTPNGLLQTEGELIIHYNTLRNYTWKGYKGWFNYVALNALYSKMDDNNSAKIFNSSDFASNQKGKMNTMEILRYQKFLINIKTNVLAFSYPKIISTFEIPLFIGAGQSNYIDTTGGNKQNTSFAFYKISSGVNWTLKPDTRYNLSLCYNFHYTQIPRSINVSNRTSLSDNFAWIRDNLYQNISANLFIKTGSNNILFARSIYNWYNRKYNQDYMWQIQLGTQFNIFTTKK